MLQTSEISPFKYKNNVIRRLKFYWLKYKSQRSAVGSRQSAVSGQRSAVGGQRSAVGSQRSAVSGYTADPCASADLCASADPSPSQSAKSASISIMCSGSPDC